MRHLFFGLLALGSSIANHSAGGVINRVNRVTGLLDAPITRPDGSGAGAGGAQAQFFLVTNEGTLVGVGSSFGFRGATDPLALYFSAGSADVPGTDPGQQVWLRVRAWVGTSWENASLRGESPDFLVTLGGGTQPPANPVGLQRFTMQPPAPEPPVLPHLTPDGKFTSSLDMSSLADLTFVRIETSPDLISWKTITTVQVKNGRATFSVEVLSDRGFYRAAGVP